MNHFKELFGLDLYSDMANEETNTFNRRMSWNPDDTLDEKYIEYMTPHALSYFSRLRPLFSFEIKDLSSLSGFSHILLRDGILFLLRFFERFPEPKNVTTKVMIHKDLAFLVPESWQSNTLLYETVLKTPSKTKGAKKDKEKLLLALTFGEREIGRESIEKLCDRILEKRNLKEIVFLPLYNVLRGEDFLSYDRARIFSQMKVFQDLLRDKKQTFIDFSQRGGLDYGDHLFHQFNPGKIYYSDSQLEHEFLSGEATPLFEKVGKEVVSLSPYHGMALSSFHLTDQQSELKKKLLSFPHTYDSEPSLNREKEDYFEIFYYSKKLLKLAYELGKEIL